MSKLRRSLKLNTAVVVCRCTPELYQEQLLAICFGKLWTGVNTFSKECLS